MQTFCERFRIVIRCQYGKLKISPEKTCALDKYVAHHLGHLKLGFENVELDEECISIANVTHVVINIDDGRTLGFENDQDIRYADITSGSEGMTIIVRINSRVNARISPRIIIFKNRKTKFPNVPDNVSSVAYRTSPKEWIDSISMMEWLNEQRESKAIPNEKLRMLFFYNCSGHNRTEDILNAAERIWTIVRYFPPNITDLFKRFDGLAIQKIKGA